MKIHFLSDLHLEFEDYTHKVPDCDLVILAGDVHQLYAGPLSGLPVGGGGNPQIGRFPYKTRHNPYVSTYD